MTGERKMTDPKNVPVVKVSKVLLDLINDAIARELQVSIQYMWQHVQWNGVRGFVARDELQSVAIEEMKHAEAIAERLYNLGGVPTTRPSPVFIGDTIKEMIARDVEDEETAIHLYKKIVDTAQAEGDETTSRLFHDITEQEQVHLNTFSNLLEDL